MAAKKSAKKQVTVTIDQETLEKLVGALQVLAEAGTAVQTAVSDPEVRAKLTGKGAKKASKKGR